MADELEATQSAPVDDAPPSEPTEVIGDDVQETPEIVDLEAENGTPNEEGDEAAITLAEAFAAAKAELGTEGTDSKETVTPSTEDSDAPAESTETSTEPAPTDETVAGNETVDHAALRRQVREELETDMRQEKAFRDLYLENERTRIEDPDAFSENVIGNPKLAEFMQQYRRAHPDVSLESPEGNLADPVRLRAEADADWTSRVTEATEFIARQNGLTNQEFAQIQTQANGKLGTMLQETFNAAVTKAAEKMRPAIAQAERTAVTAELTAKFAQTRAVTPRPIGGNMAAKTPSSDPDISPVRAALEEAKLELANR